MTLDRHIGPPVGAAFWSAFLQQRGDELGDRLHARKVWRFGLVESLVALEAIDGAVALASETERETAPALLRLALAALGPRS